MQIRVSYIVSGSVVLLRYRTLLVKLLELITKHCGKISVAKVVLSFSPAL